MPALSLPAPLANPAAVSGRVVSKLLLDLTVYLVGPTEAELEHLIRHYERLCPVDRLTKYKIAELDYWPLLARPVLTRSARAAAAAGVARPYLEPVRQRIRDGRAFEVQFWDGRRIDDPEGSWSFNCRSIKLRASGLHAFVRLLVPLSQTDVITRAAAAIADSVAFYSGHGGLAFVYDPWMQGDAFDAIYARSRRFWGVDVEDLNDTLPLMRDAIKGINWITMLGPRLDPEGSDAQVARALAAIASVSDVAMQSFRHGSVLKLGPAPVAGDQHRPDNSLDPYYAVATALEPLFLKSHPDFPGQRFIENGNTLGWIRRFIDPAGWR